VIRGTGICKNATMNAIIRNVTEIDNHDRQALEHILGQPLEENQRIVIQVETAPSPSENWNPNQAQLPEWCNVFEGLTDAEIAEIESISLSRANMTRPAEWCNARQYPRTSCRSLSNLRSRC
jgi:hypothetical protein